MRHLGNITVAVLLILTIISFRQPDIATTRIDSFGYSDYYFLVDQGDNPVLGFNTATSKLTNLETSEVIDNFWSGKGYPSMVYTTTGERLVVSYGQTFYIYDAADYALLTQFKESSLDPFYGIAFLDDQLRLYSLNTTQDDGAAFAYQLNVTGIDYMTGSRSAQLYNFTSSYFLDYISSISPDGDKIVLEGDLVSSLYEIGNTQTDTIEDINYFYNYDISWSPDSEYFILTPNLDSIFDLLSVYSVQEHQISTLLLPESTEWTSYEYQFHSFFHNHTILLTKRQEANILYPSPHSIIYAMDIVEKSIAWDLRVQNVEYKLAMTNDEIFYVNDHTVYQVDLTQEEYTRINMVSQILWLLLGLALLVRISSFIIQTPKDRWEKVLAETGEDQAIGPYHNFRLFALLSALQIKNIFLFLVLLIPDSDFFFLASTWIIVLPSFLLDGFVWAYLLYLQRDESWQDERIVEFVARYVLFIGFFIMTIILLFSSEDGSSFDLELLWFGLFLFGFIFTQRQQVVKYQQQEQRIDFISNSAVFLIGFDGLVLLLLSAFGNTDFMRLSEDIPMLRIILAVGFLIIVNYWIVGVEGKHMDREGIFYLHTLISLYAVLYLIIAYATSTFAFFELMILILGLYTYYLIKLRQYWYSKQI